MKCKHWIILLIATLVVSNTYLAYIIVDNGVTMTYQESSFDMAQKSYEQTLRIANLNIISRNADDAIKLLGKDVYGLDPFEKEGCLYIGQVCLLLDENRTITRVGENTL